MSLRDKVIIGSLMAKPQPMPAALKEWINTTIKEQGSVMLEHKEGKLYWLPKHWVYLDYKKDAPRVKVGNTNLPDNYEYLTDPLK